MKKVLLIKFFIAALFFSTASMAEKACPNESFDLNFRFIGPTLIHPGGNLYITVQASNVPSKVFNRGIERVEWDYEVYGYRKLETPVSGTVGNCNNGCFGYLQTHEEVLILEVTEESPTYMESRYSMLDIPELADDFENKIWIRAYMRIYYKANFFERLFGGCDVNYAYSNVDIEKAVCHTPSISFYTHDSAPIANYIPAYNIIRERNAIEIGIPLGQTETRLDPRIGGIDIDGLELAWSADHPDWTVSPNTGGVDEDVILYTDGYSTNGTVTTIIDATNCQSAPKSFEGLPITRYIPRPDVVTAPAGICEQYESTIEIQGNPFATGYVWELVQGPVTLNGASVQTLITTEPRLNIKTTSYGYTHIRVRYQTDIDHLVENNNLYMMYDVEYDPRNATKIQTISNLRWRNFEFWSGGSGPTTTITQTSRVIENCKGPVVTYGINEPVGAVRYEWEFIASQSPAPSYLNEIIHVEKNKFSVDGYIRMNDGESVQFTARVKVYGTNNCTPEIEERFIRYRYLTNDPDGTCQGIFDTGLLIGGRAGKELEGSLTTTEAPETWEPKVFPNPTSDLLQLNIPVEGTYAVSIYNTSEQLVFQDKSIKSRLSLNVSQYPQGLYIMNIHDISGNLVKANKVVIKH